MRTIVLANQKGGAGKTTMASALAVEAQRRGDGPVALVDTDPQGGLAAWWNLRAEETPAFADPDPYDLAGTLARLAREGFALAIIDTPPQVTAAIAAAVAVADLVVVPVRASPNDLHAVAATVDLIELNGRRLLFVVNATKPRVRLTAEAVIALSEHGAVAPVMVGDRADYAGAMTDGRTAPELDPEGKAALEVAQLWEYIARKAGIRHGQARSTHPDPVHARPQRKRRAASLDATQGQAADARHALPDDGARFDAAQGEERARRPDGAAGAKAEGQARTAVQGHGAQHAGDSAALL